MFYTGTKGMFESNNAIVITDIDNSEIQNALCETNNLLLYLDTVKIDKIAPCIGCSRCMFDTPGICIHEDVYQSITAISKNCDRFILISRLTYGSYSASVKKMLDRTYPCLKPFFKRKNGHTKHCRYKSKPFIFYSFFLCEQVSEDEKRLAKYTAESTAFHLGATSLKLFFCFDDKELIKCLKKVFS